ncbi:hypothetical protein GGX14DRAFT_558148 [Mycena pura]|uniref:Uncharacterized protein n=1 Tax=Mycena pura TaxID=153505 RepID=A0AAD6VAV0_9AGAR|nr:hypothetical protein GGX14DRAFT_567975 [Mycena pura]KAJ7223580.1 hypothetical protein GGX14DRAFT_558148 [Mycena pura]
MLGEPSSSSIISPMHELVSNVRLGSFTQDNADSVQAAFALFQSEYHGIFSLPKAPVQWDHIVDPKFHATLSHALDLCAKLDPKLLLLLSATHDGDAIRIRVSLTDEFSLEEFYSHICCGLARHAAYEAAYYGGIRSESLTAYHDLRVDGILPHIHVENDGWAGDESDVDSDELPELVDVFE